MKMNPLWDSNCSFLRYLIGSHRSSTTSLVTHCSTYSISFVFVVPKLSESVQLPPPSFSAVVAVAYFGPGFSAIYRIPRTWHCTITPVTISPEKGMVFSYGNHGKNSWLNTGSVACQWQMTMVWNEMRLRRNARSITKGRYMYSRVGWEHHFHIVC